MASFTRFAVLSVAVAALVAALPASVVAQATTQPVAGQPTTAPSEVMAEIRGQKLTWGEIQVIKQYLAPSATTEQIVQKWKYITVLTDEFHKSGLEQNAELKPALNLAMSAQIEGLYPYFKAISTPVTDQDIQNEYDKLGDNREFHEPEVVTVKFIAAKDKPDLSGIKERLIKGEDFDKVMQEFAEQTKQVLGISDPTQTDVRADRLRDVLGLQWSALGVVQLNQVLGPIKTPGGETLYKVVARTAGALKPLDEVREQLKERLKRARMMEIRREITEAAQKEAGIEPRPAPQPRFPATRPGVTTRPGGTVRVMPKPGAAAPAPAPKEP
jgi:hypothetical protein